MGWFIQRYRNFLLSVVYLAAGLMAAGYSLLYSERDTWSAQVNAATTLYESENRKLRKALKEVKEEAQTDASQADGAIRSLPDFLERINNIANETNVIIRELSPDRESKWRFTIKIIEDYFDFLRFASLLESLNVSIHNIEVHPYDLGKNPPLHAITFSLTPRNDAEPLSGRRISELKAKVAEKGKRNPFRRLVYDEKRKRAIPEIDLTWIYKLSGIGRVGGVRYATINSKDYSAGDKLDGMEIVEVASDRLRLIKQTPNGIEKYLLKFRTKKK